MEIATRGIPIKVNQKSNLRGKVTLKLTIYFFKKHAYLKVKI
jgi:hypothetical protein